MLTCSSKLFLKYPLPSSSHTPLPILTLQLSPADPLLHQALPWSPPCTPVFTSVLTCTLLCLQEVPFSLCFCSEPPTFLLPIRTSPYFKSRSPGCFQTFLSPLYHNYSFLMPVNSINKFRKYMNTFSYRYTMAEKKHVRNYLCHLEIKVW